MDFLISIGVIVEYKSMIINKNIQENGIDCEVYVCRYIELFENEIPSLKIYQYDIDDLRVRIYNNIIEHIKFIKLI